VPVPVPSLDDRTYDDLIRQARALIPRTAPAWTDHNPSDPGTTLTELFAYLVETLFYQQDRITDRTLAQFARLLGVVPAPGESAAAALGRAVDGLAVPARAITAADVAFQLGRGLFEAVLPVAGPHPAGTPVVAHGRLVGVAQLVSGVAGTDSATIGPLVDGRPVTVLPGDQFVVDEPAEVLVVDAVGPADGAGLTTVTCRSVLRSDHARAPLDRITGPLPGTGTTLAAPVAAGGQILRLTPVPAMPGEGVLALGGPSATEFLPVRGVGRTGVAVVARADPDVGGPDSARAGGADARVDHIVRVLLVPQVAGVAAPAPSAALLQAGYEVLRATGPLGTPFQTAGPTYRQLTLGAVLVRATTSLLGSAQLAAAAAAALRRHLDPLVGGRDGGGWEFGRPVYRSELYGVLEAVAGVDHVAQLSLDGDPTISSWPADGFGQGDADCLVELAAVDVAVRDR
jgi:hypothetical protein